MVEYKDLEFTLGAEYSGLVIFSILKSWLWTRSPKRVRRRTDQRTQMLKGQVEEYQPVDWKMIRKVGRIKRKISKKLKERYFKMIVQSI